MADSSLSNLNYGRPGLSTYDLDNREWAFSRQPIPKKLKQIAGWQLALPPAIDSSAASTSTNATTHRKNIRRLAHDHPQLVAATRQLPELNAISEAVEFAASTYDPLVGDLLSFGTVFVKQYGKPRCIAALPAGPSGSILRLVVLGQQRQGWGGDKSVWLSGPTFENADSGYWNQDAVPIQQVCFAKAEGVDSILAVRLPARTVFFRPSFHRGRQATEPSSHYDLPPSTISARSLLSITLEQTGGGPHADVTFNPDYQFQFGIVDQRNNWTVWELDRRAKRNEYSVSRLVGGNILADVEEEDADNGDGWARMLWAGDSNTILVCNRRHLRLVNIKGDTSDYLPAPVIVPQRSTDWILDIRRHPRYQNQFFILTSTRLFVVAVTTLSATVDSTAGHAGMAILLSRRHYRGDEDLSIQLSVQTLVDDRTCIFLSSQLNRLVQIFYLQGRSSESLEFAAISDPVAFDIAWPSAAHIKHMQLQLLEYGTQVQPRINHSNVSARSYLERAIPFYQLTLVSADLSVYQTVLLPAEFARDCEPIAWAKVLSANRLLYTSANSVGEIDDFVVPDGLEWKTYPGSKLKSQALRLLPQSDRQPEKAMDFRTMYNSLISGDQDTELTSGRTSVESLTEQLRVMLADVVEAGPGGGHLMETFDAAIDVSDIDEASTKLIELFTTNDSSGLHTLRHIAPADFLHLPATGDRSVASLYDTILQEWIAPLPAEIPIPVRQAKERLARRIAVEVTLASVQLRLKNDELPSPRGMVSGDSVSLPILSSKPVDMFPPTPPQSSVPPSSPLFPQSLRSLRSDPLSRLRRHLTINDNSLPKPMLIPQSVTELLSHWDPGADPRTYDWEAAERANRPEAPDDTSQELREKERKRRERRDKRQRREDELMRTKSQTNSQPMPLQPAFPRSSPGPMFGGMEASSQVPIPISSQILSQSQSQGGGLGGFGGNRIVVPQSQVEPGRFGGRPDKKKKKGRSRVSGF